MAGACEYGNELSGSLKCGEFLEWMRTGQLLKDSAPWSKYGGQLVPWSRIFPLGTVY